jgi:transposase
MSFRELSMIEVKEVLRRREAGQGLREIARETGIDRKTVRRYVRAADEAGTGPRPRRSSARSSIRCRHDHCRRRASRASGCRSTGRSSPSG